MALKYDLKHRKQNYEVKNKKAFFFFFKLLSELNGNTCREHGLRVTKTVISPWFIRSTKKSDVSFLNLNCEDYTYFSST